jgi:Protein of unknown function (DUF1761)
MEINYLAVFTCAVLSMVLGSVWYGPLFGKKWMEITGATECDAAERKQMQKEALPLYIAQFLLTLFQVWAFARLVGSTPDSLLHALWIWVAFVMPTVAGSAMWNNDKNNVKWARFLIQSGYQLLLFALVGIVIGMWK